MKKLLYLLSAVAFLTFSVTLTSCGSDDDPAPQCLACDLAGDPDTAIELCEGDEILGVTITKETLDQSKIGYETAGMTCAFKDK